MKKILTIILLAQLWSMDVYGDKTFQLIDREGREIEKIFLGFKNVIFLKNSNFSNWKNLEITSDNLPLKYNWKSGLIEIIPHRRLLQLKFYLKGKKEKVLIDSIKVIVALMPHPIVNVYSSNMEILNKEDTIFSKEIYFEVKQDDIFSIIAPEDTKIGFWVYLFNQNNVGVCLDKSIKFKPKKAKKYKLNLINYCKNLKKNSTIIIIKFYGFSILEHSGENSPFSYATEFTFHCKIPALLSVGR